MSQFRFPRMFGWLLLAVALMAIIAAIAPQKLEVTTYKLCLITLAGVIGYWLDRGLFPYARPDFYLLNVAWKEMLLDGGRECASDVPVAKGYEQVFAFAMLRRALIVGACILGVAMGL